MQAGFFILLGYPDETTADIKMTIDFLKETQPDVVGTSVAFPIKGTSFYERVEDRLIARGLASRPHRCWDLPQQFAGDPGAPLTRLQLRKLARLPHGYRGAVNDPHPHNGRRHTHSIDG